MAAGTGVIAFAPTYATIGVGAPICCWWAGAAGIYDGGEVRRRNAYLLEKAIPPRKRTPPPVPSRHGSRQHGLANIWALAAFSVTALLREAEVRAWGWRLPFISDSPLAPVGLYLRRHLGTKTAEFSARGGPARDSPSNRSAFIDDFSPIHGQTLLIGFWWRCVGGGRLCG